MIDLTMGHRGLLTLRDGRKFYSTSIQPSGQLVTIRLDKGREDDWAPNGRYDEDKEHPFDIVKFDPEYRFLDAVRNNIPDYIEL